MSVDYLKIQTLLAEKIKQNVNGNQDSFTDLQISIK